MDPKAMARKKYRSTPFPSKHMPKGIPYIISNEFAERFSFYGMRGILFVYMTHYLMGPDVQQALMTNEKATEYFHLFVMSAYIFPILGAILSDGFLGKYRTIITLSFVYVLGHLALAVDETRVGLLVGLGLIAVGSGGIKPCVSAHVGDQFGAQNERLITKVFSWFYFSINLGATISSLLTPVLLSRYGPGVAFGVPGVLMFIATIAFWMGRNVFIHIPPGGPAFVKEAFSGEGLRAMMKLSVVFVFIAMFWALFDQTGSTWVLQARDMDRHCMGVEWLPSQLQAVNPILILILIPTFSYGIYPFAQKFVKVTPLRKITVGLFMTSTPFFISAWIQQRIDAGQSPNIQWQIYSYVILTAAEVLVSITALEFAYTQAPKKMKSLIMGLFLSSVALGNAFTAAVNFFIQNEDGSSKLEGPNYFLFFALLMTVTAVLFLVVALTYKEKRYIQEEDPEEARRAREGEAAPADA